MKKIFGISLLICVLTFCLLLLPQHVNAETEGYYTYTVTENQATITKFNGGIEGEIIVPNTLGGYPVTSIGIFAFGNRNDITSVVLPDSLTTIGFYAFERCSNLTSIVIPNSVNEIYEYAFKDCSSLKDVYISDVESWCNIQFPGYQSNPMVYADNLYVNGTLITDLVIPETVERIYDYAFYDCDSLTGVTIPDSVKNIGVKAFYSCDNISVVSLGNGINEIGINVFSDCISLESIVIPEGITKIVDSFSGCSKLKQVVLPNSILDITWKSFDGCPVKSNSYNDANYLGNDENPYLVLMDGGASNDISRIIHEDTKVIAGGAFIYRKLRSIDIPASVVSICEYAFYGCDSLPTISGAENVQYMGASAFAKSALTSFTIPKGVTIISEMIFCDCRQLSEVIIPDGVTEIGEFAFGTCWSLNNVVLPESLMIIGGRAFDGCSRIKEIEIPSSVTNIGVYAFSRCTSLKTVNLSEGLTTIGAYVFEECSNLTDISIPKSVTYIGGSAFIGCKGLVSIEIPEGVQSIQSGTFERCGNLKSVVMPVSVTEIDRWAFSYCTALETVYYAGSKEQKQKIRIRDYNDYLLAAEWIYDYSTIHTCRYSDWNMTIAPTFQSEGKRERVCSECGNIEEEVIPIAVANIVSWNLKLENDIQVNFYLEISESIESTARVRIYVGEEGFTHRVSKIDKTEEGLYIASVNIAAAQMSDYIFVTVLNGNDISSTMSYTVRQYADTILANESYSKYHTLVKEMLNYGAAAQVYFDYEAGNLANSGITGTGNVEIPDSVDDTLSVDGKANGIAFYGASLIFRDRIAVRYYFGFEGQINNMTFAVNDQQYAPQLKDGLYFIEIADILPQNLDQQITLTVTDADGNALTVTYGPMNYIVRMNEKGDDALKALVKALYNYHLAAKALTA